ncbi:hypothetical protein [Haloferax sulfurifontis]|uniref:Uncharacterized protein n=1 Tax=Haloferax sulfurifontis TaxID=255616 RepID=A0A830E3I1_9EURY|nr:hypothetical protein [Haloferax sulfurifontis]GGC49895.1 hypothetical protein GCM10007209_09450 [Haloferax sulfurifontis]
MAEPSYDWDENGGEIKLEYDDLRDLFTDGGVQVVLVGEHRNYYPTITVKR